MPHLAVLDPSQNPLSAREAPTFEIPIPGVTLTSVTNPNDYSIPWVGQYINGVYTFMLGIVGLLAAIMMIIGGFQYLTSAGDSGKIGAAKKRITDALIGLALALGSYALLYTINPDLVSFKSLDLFNVQSESIDEVLVTTDVDTDAETRAEEASIPQTAPGSHTSSFPNCPFTLPGTSDEAQNKEAFYQQIQTSGKITATLPGERVVQIADLAVACGMRFGNCGRTAGLISALATDNSCLENDIQKGCNDFHGTQVHGISAEQRRYLWGWRCFEDPKGTYKQYVRADCKMNAKDAMAQVRSRLVEIPGWPEKWAEDLRPGDYVKVYSGIEDPIGSHSLIFTGWAAGGVNGGKMQAVSGSSGTATHANKAICVTSACGQNYQLLLYIFRPN